MACPTVLNVPGAATLEVWLGSAKAMVVDLPLVDDHVFTIGDRDVDSIPTSLRWVRMVNLRSSPAITATETP